MALKKSHRPEVFPPALREAMLRRVTRQLSASGEINLPCVPSLLEHYVEILGTQFKTLGRPFNAAEVAHLRQLLTSHLEEGFNRSPHCRLVVRYSTDAYPAVTLSYQIEVRVSTMEDQYQHWVETRTPPLFGAHPDAKVMALAGDFGPPKEAPVLDIGAGTGRNSLPLARLGHPVTAVEVAPALADILAASAAEQGTSLELLRGNVLSPDLPLGLARYKLVILAEVVSHFREKGQLRQLFERVAAALAPGGVLLFSAFIAHDSYTPDRMARELSQTLWSSAFTRREFAEGVSGLPLEPWTDESVHDYEKVHLPKEAWPPTGWFSEWSQGYDVYALGEGQRPPLELRWVAYRRQ